MFQNYPAEDTPVRKQEFLKEYAENFNIRQSCQNLNIHRSTIYKWFAADPQFKEAFDALNEAALNGVMSTLLEALYSEDWALRKWAVEQLKKSRLLGHLSELTNNSNDNPNNINIDKDNIVLL